ncbi:MAG TPA: ATP-dependent Clp protease ATP-binding subunit [Thermotogota bacterium]|nr:ATP-dependent Clp protease ATP-binding subunit [Thermotogota bacterium]
MFFDKFTNKASELFLMSQKEAESLGHMKIEPEHFLLSVLKDVYNPVFGLLVHEFRIDYPSARNEVIRLVGKGARSSMSLSPQISEKFREILEMGYEEAKVFGQPNIGVEHIFLAILRSGDNNAVLALNNLGLETQDFVNELLAKMNVHISPSSPQKKGKSPVVIKQLEEFGENLNDLAENQELDPVIGREEEIQRVMQVLARRKKNNPVLIGDPGVGKTAIVEGLAQRIVNESVPEFLRNKTIFSLDIASLVAGTKYRGEFEKRIKKVLSVISQDSSIILFIDEIHTIVGAGAAEGAVDAANILKPALSRGSLHCIGATTPDEYRKYIEKDAALERRFQKIYVMEPTVDQTVQILEGLKPKYEAHHQVQYTDEALKESVKLSRTYISDHFLPDMAIDVIDEAGAKKHLKKLTLPPELKEMELETRELKLALEKANERRDFEQVKDLQAEEREKIMEFNRLYQEWKAKAVSEIEIVEMEDVAQVVSSWTGIPLARIESDEQQKLLHLEDALHQRVVGQDEAISTVAKSIRRARSGLKDPLRPVGSFLFLGPTGVGKTELAKTLAQFLFGDERALLRFDMSEYMERFAVSRMIGAPPGYVGYEEGGSLTESVRRKPYSVVLMDEIEKADPDVYNILLQIMDEGRLTDSQGRIVDFRNAVLIMTSNIGGEIINKSKHVLGFGVANDHESKYQEMKNTVTGEVKKVFRPEFLNRLDGTIVFHQLEEEHISSIIDILLSRLEVRLLEKGLKLELKSTARQFLMQEGFDPVYGARPLKRAIQKHIEDPLAEEILKKTFSPGETIVIAMSRGAIVFRKKSAKDPRDELVLSASE